jgi:hypothetical protein
MSADQIIDPVMARALQADACRSTPLVGWLVTRGTPEHPHQIVARLVTDAPTPYVLVADTLGELHALLPRGLIWSESQPADPPAVVEIWFARST